MESIHVSHAGGVGFIGLNNPDALNALTLEMAEYLTHVLVRFRDDPEVNVVVLHSDSPKAFCAGGDVKRIASDLIEGRGDGYAREFFQVEYDLDLIIHQFPKPILVWGDGIVMGGGMGLMIGASHRVLTERSMLAMPEISIGFFPDVGGGYFLNRLPDGVGLFLGLTGARMNAADAHFLGIATDVLPSQEKAMVFRKLTEQSWDSDGRKNRNLLTQLLEKSPEGLSLSVLKRHLPEIQRRMRGTHFREIDGALRSWMPTDPWLMKSVATYVKGSPHSARVIFQHLKHCDGMALVDVFQVELKLALEMVNYPDFSEGVRALLIDKTGDPVWS